MTAQLAKPRSAESSTTDTTQFPYGAEDTGLPLPTAHSRGVLRPRNASDAVGAAGSTDCPACDAETINGAGLFACTNCSWNGSLR
ncbi:hypothetical protein CV102_08105 [Natronococcus pandeyae]|uniref:Uncharacterized protein n=1 Tax=Natronococcus pandeyae TaxID=2055836 RepID=A0A8J8Q7S7_9EURY|nr:hypothetical protein [Natronococcus pandeyae]TYL39239.1 hypothetical protein CV102_08105 [Natronococcus pandeyae]